MRAINHHIVTGLTVWALTGTVGYGLVAAAVANLPDWIDRYRHRKEGEEEKTEKPSHRQIGHWFVPWLMALLLSGAILYRRIVFWNPGYLWTTLVLLALVALSGLLHIVEDAVCGTVPDYRLRKRRWGKRLFRVNSAKEHTLVCIYSIGLLVLCMALRRGLF